MTSVSPPTYYFNGITFNSAFYTTSSSGGLSQSQANALYLKKNTADTASALETFSGGIVSDSYDSSTSSATTTLAANNLTGNINIGNGNRTAGTISIGSGTTSASTAAISIGTDLTTINLKGNAKVYSMDAMTTGLTANTLSLGTGSSTTAVSLGTNANVTTITIGGASSAVQFNGNCKFTNALQTPSIDAALSGGTLQVGSSNAGSITLGSSTIPTTAAGGFSMGTGKNITLQPTASYAAPIAGQLGFVNENTGTVTPAANTNTNITSISPTTAGVYLVIASFTVAVSSTSGYTVWLNTTSASQVGNKGIIEAIILNGWPQQTYNTSAVFTSTVAPTFYLSVSRTSAIDPVSGKISVTRIA